MAKRVLTALGSDPTQGFVMLNRSGTPIWASDSVFSLVDFAANAADPFLDALHPDDVELCSEIFGVEREGVADTTFGMDRRFELIVRIRSPRGGWRPVALRLLNLVDNPEVDGMLLAVDACESGAQHRRGVRRGSARRTTRRSPQERPRNPLQWRIRQCAGRRVRRARAMHCGNPGLRHRPG